LARKRTYAVNDAYDVILQKILSFELMPGEAVSDSLLAQQLNMSRTPIREAIVRLVTEGLIEQGETRMLVKTISPNDITELLDVREAIETKAVRLIIQSGGLSTAQIQELNDANEEMRKHVEGNDFQKNFIADDHLHNLLVKFSDNSRLYGYSVIMQMQCHRARWLTVFSPRYRESIDEHRAIIEALARGDLNDSLKAVETHLMHAMANFKSVLFDSNTSQFMRRIISASVTLNTK